MDIEYLLFLQNLREASGDIFNEFFNAITKITVDVMPFMPFVILWCVNTKWGYRALITYWFCDSVNAVIKLTACVYRPWIRDARIEPAGDAKVAATGYSFPSGHSTVATATYGTIFAWQRKKRTWVAVLCGVLIALTMFSRNFLGVHTPQDVLTGFSVTAITVFIILKVADKIAGNEKVIDIMAAAGILFVIAMLLYINLKSYPMDYVDDKLLVDPQKMMNDAFKASGGLLGLCIGSYIERHYIRYEIPYCAVNLPIMTILGVALLFSWENYFGPATFVFALGAHWGNFISHALMVIFALTIWPMVIRKSAVSAEAAEN